MRKERSLDILRALLLLSILEGIPTIIFLFRIPSDVDNSTLFGFAPQRVGLGALFVFLLILMIYYFMRSILDDPWFKRIGERIDNALSRGNRLLVSVTTLSFVVFSGILGMILFSTPILQLFGPIQHIYVRSISLIIWFILVSSQALIILLWVYHPIWQSPRYFFKVETFQILLLLIVLGTTLFHWTILILKDAVLASFPYWWGNFRPQPFSIRDFLVLISIALVLIAIRIITVSSQGAIRKLGFLIFLGFIIQVSFGFIKGGGFRSLEAALTNSIQDRFAVEAAQGLDFLEMTRQYEEHHGQRFLPATKPPGALALYILFEKIASINNPSNNMEQRYQNITTFASYAFPLLSLLIVVPMYLLSIEINKADIALIAPLIMILTPNFVLMHLQLDQFIYPLLFVIGILITWKSVSNQSLTIAFISGIWMYLSIFISFSLLPMIAMGLLIIVLSIFIEKDIRNSLVKNIPLLISTCAGFIFSRIVFYGAFGYDPIIRYQNAIAHHRTGKLFQSGLSQISIAIAQNNLEFLYWIGAPLFLLTISRFIRSGIQIIRGNGTNFDILSLSFFITFIALNLFGQTRGEVGRIWLFILPIFTMLATDEARILTTRHRLQIKTLPFIQLFTTYLLFKFYPFF